MTGGKMKTLTRRLSFSALILLLLFTPWEWATAMQPLPVASQPAALVSPESPLAAIFNTNLIPGGDAEVPYALYWHDNENYTQIIPYGQSCEGGCIFPSPYDPGPELRGTNFFYLGHTANHSAGNNMWLNNKISLAAIQGAVSSGKVRYILSGYFGGQTTQIDAAQLQMFFETSGGTPAGLPVIVGNVSPAERQYQTGLVYRQISGTLPPGTQNINLALQSGTLSGSDYRTGYADNLSLILLPIRTFLPVLNNGSPVQPSQTGIPAPSGVFVSKNGLTRMDIYWTDNSTNELGFEVQRINADASVDTICNTKPAVTYCTDPGISHASASGYMYLGNQVTYTYQVRAIGQGKNSNWANGSGTTAQMPLSVPVNTHGAFTCQAIDTTSTSTTFVWNDPFNYEAGFNLYLGSNSYPSWTMMERGTRISFINQVPGSITLRMVPFVYDRANPTVIYESATSCTATAVLPNPPGNGITRFFNDASYPVISLTVDGMEQFPVRPLGILSGAYYELYGVTPGFHTWTAATGFWDDWGRRFTMYLYSGSFNQPASGAYAIHIPDMSINNLLSVPPTNLGYWEGYYFDAYANCYTVAFKFKQDGTYAFYNANNQIGTGTYSLVSRQPNIFTVNFHVAGSQAANGMLIETHGQFFMQNGPLSWPQITYVYKPQGYVRNPFCP
jgi:hypothetical protein